MMVARLVADVSLLDARLAHGRAPNADVAAELLEVTRLLSDRLEILITRVRMAYPVELDEPAQDQLRAAARQLRATAEVLSGLPEALNRPSDH